MRTTRSLQPTYEWRRVLRRTRVAAQVVSVSILLLGALACSRQAAPRDQAQATARGDALLRQMSDTLRGASALSFSVRETHERVRRNGTKVPFTLDRQVVVRRPDRLHVHTTGSDGRDVTVTYDGRAVTVVGRTHQVYAAVDAPPSLDATLDLVSERYDLRLSVADLLYSSPYESFADRDARGGWTRTADQQGMRCEEVAYVAPRVSYTLAIRADAPHLPCSLRITYLKEPGSPTTSMVFSAWNLAPTTAEGQFTASVPANFERIPIVERVPRQPSTPNPASSHTERRK